MPTGIPTKIKICPICGDEFLPEKPSQRYCKKDHYQPCPICGNPVLWNSKREVPVCSRECKLKRMRSRNQAKYGVDHPMLLPSVQAKHKATLKKHYGVEYALQSEEIKSKINKVSKSNYTSLFKCYKSFLTRNNSEIKNKVDPVFVFSQHLINNNIKHTIHKNVGRYNYDICLTDSNILIDLDTTYKNNLKQVNSEYHLDKTENAKEYGYRCIHIFDWEDWNKIIDLISPRKYLIGARKCNIVELTNNKICNKFINENHLQGQTRGSLISLCLKYNNEIVEMMTFGKSRYNKQYDYELLRLCSKKDTTVVGGASKLFRYAVNNLQLNNIVSYCDISKFSGNVYHKIGMRLVYISAPNIIWSNSDKKVTSNLLRQRGFDQLFRTNHGKGTDNEVLMLDAGWLPICDCGQLVFEYVN